MGAELWIRGTEHELCTRDECGLVSGWISEHHVDRRPIDEQMGSWEFPASAVSAADRFIFLTFTEAYLAGQVPEDSYTESDVEMWLHCREFLKLAAEAGEGVSGSY